MPSLFQLAQAHRRELLDRDSAAARALVEDYRHVHERIQERLSELARQMEAAKARGEEINPAWLMQYDRLDSLSRQVGAEVERYTYRAALTITQAQSAAAALAETHALASIGLASTFARLPVGAVQDIAGFLADGAPFRALLSDLSPRAALRVRQSLITGVALGHGPRKIASAVRADMGGSLTQALTLSRTSVINAYRTSTLRTYQANADVVKAWRWVAAKSSRTCLNCLARDGSVWPLKKPMPSHWNCRCTFVPVLDGQEWKRQSGAEWFESQPAETKREMLGPKAFEAYERGKVRLSDFAGQRRDRHLGMVAYQRSLKKALARKRKVA